MKRALLALRVMVGIGLLGLYIQVGGPGSLTALHAAANTPLTAGVSYDDLRATLPEAELNVLMSAAARVCSPDQPVLVLSDDPITWLQGNYLLYPRRLNVVQSMDGFTAADLNAHTNGCLITYGPARARLDPFRARLSQAVCAGEDCLYRILNVPS